jgi:hypothetical protein
MYIRKKKVALGASLVALTLALAGCGGGGGDSSSAAVVTDVTEIDQSNASEPNTTDANVSLVATENAIDVSSASLVSSATKMEGGITTRSAADFNFPEVVNTNGSITMTIPNGPAPSFPARRDISSGGGQTIQFGDPVSLKYDMFSWSTTTFPEHKQNVDITTGDWRALNLEEAPFNFPPPLRLMNEEYKHAEYFDKALALWRIEDIRCATQTQ